MLKSIRKKLKKLNKKSQLMAEELGNDLKDVAYHVRLAHETLKQEKGLIKAQIEKLEKNLAMGGTPEDREIIIMEIKRLTGDIEDIIVDPIETTTVEASTTTSAQTTEGGESTTVPASTTAAPGGDSTTVPASTTSAPPESTTVPASTTAASDATTTSEASTTAAPEDVTTTVPAFTTEALDL